MVNVNVKVADFVDLRRFVPFTISILNNPSPGSELVARGRLAEEVRWRKIAAEIENNI